MNQNKTYFLHRVWNLFILALNSLKPPIRRKWLRRSFLGSWRDPGQATDQRAGSRTSEQVGEGSHFMKRKKGQEEDKNVEVLKVRKQKLKFPASLSLLPEVTSANSLANFLLRSPSFLSALFHRSFCFWIPSYKLNVGPLRWSSLCWCLGAGVFRAPVANASCSEAA